MKGEITMYVARARVNMLNKDDRSFVSDEILGVYLVEERGIDYYEVVTKKRLTKHTASRVGIDIEANEAEEFGTINWKIFSIVKAEDLLTEEEIKKYMSISPEQMKLYIENMRAKAKEIAVKYYRECNKIGNIGPKLK